MGATLEPVYKEIIKLFSDRAIANRGVTKADKGFQEIYDSFMSAMGGQHITDISDTTRRQVMNVIAQNQDAGVAVISKAITDRMSPRFTRARASTIARTETHSASSFSNHEQYKSFNEPTMMKRWVANADERTRPSHYAVSGTEIGIDDTFSVAGKLMKYTGDPSGGASEIINCRCVTIYFESEDVFVDATTETPPPVVPTQDTIPRRRATSDTVKIIPRLEAIKILKRRFKDANDDERYPRNETRFKGDSGKYGDVGGVINKQGSDNTLSAIVAVMDELDELAEKLNVPKLRGIKSIRQTRKAAIATMGDGVLGVNVKDFNRWSKGMGKPQLTPSEILKIQAPLRDKMDILEKEIDVIAVKGRKGGATIRAENLTAEEIQKYNDLAKAQNKLTIEWNSLEISAKTTTSNWKFGDKLKDRPHNAFEYYEDSFDRLRNTMFHEFGHQVHQQYQVQGRIGAYYSPPTERAMAGSTARSVSSSYGDKNTKEWFAENFSLWADNKLELVDERFKKIITSIVNNQDVEKLL